MKYLKSGKFYLILFFTIFLLSAVSVNDRITEKDLSRQSTQLAAAESPSTAAPHASPEINREAKEAAQEPVHSEPKTETAAEAVPESGTKQAAAQENTDTVSQPQAERKIHLADRKGTKTAAAKQPAADKQVDAPVPPAAPQSNHADTDLNSYVLNVIASYPLGNYPYLLNNDYRNYNGVTENLYYQGSIIAKAHPSGNRASHCSGITFEVFFKAMQARNRKLGLPIDDFNGMSFSQLQDFQMLWYVASGNKRTSNVAAAVEKYGIGRQIHNWEEAKKGDFLDFSRSNHTGHTVVFLHWVRDNDGRIIGLHYWSSQGSTNGINYVTEYFDFSGRGNVLSNHVYIARVLPVKQYK